LLGVPEIILDLYVLLSLLIFISGYELWLIIVRTLPNASSYATIEVDEYKLAYNKEKN